MTVDEAWDFGVRGGNDGKPVELVGEFTGYNNNPTMQVGLWIRNDGEHFELARAVALASGPEALRAHLIQVMRFAPFPSVAHSAWDAAIASGGGIPCVDWVQIAYDLIGSDPEQEDFDTVRNNAGFPGLISEDMMWRLAAKHRAERVSRWLTEGAR